MVNNDQQLSTRAKTVKKGQKWSKNGFKKEGKKQTKKVKNSQNSQQWSTTVNTVQNGQKPSKTAKNNLKRSKTVNNGEQR